jgi:antitoxin PrlF
MRARAKLAPNGRLLIPAAMREAAGLKPGDVFLQIERKGRVVVERVDDAIARARSLVRPYVKEGESLVDELIADRRQEAERE